MRVADAVHLFDTSGTIACKGLGLAEAARPQLDGPLKMTLDRCEVTCRSCRAVIERLEKEAVA